MKEVMVWENTLQDRYRVVKKPIPVFCSWVKKSNDIGTGSQGWIINCAQ